MISEEFIEYSDVSFAVRRMRLPKINGNLFVENEKSEVFR